MPEQDLKIVRIDFSQFQKAADTARAVSVNLGAGNGSAMLDICADVIESLCDISRQQEKTLEQILEQIKKLRR